MGTKTLVGCSVTPLVLTSVVLGGLVWGIASYVGVTREQVRLEQTWAPMENAWMHRRQLVRDLLDAAGRTSVADPGVIDEVARAARDAGEFVISPELLNDDVRFGAFLDAQDDLDRRVDVFLERYGGDIGARAPSAFDRIRTQLEATDEKLEVGRVRFNDAVASYNRKIEGFPDRVIAALLDLHAKRPWTVEATEAPAPAPAPAAGSGH